MLFKFNRRKSREWAGIEVMQDITSKKYLSDALLIYDSSGNRIALIDKDSKSKYIGIKLSQGCYAMTADDNEKFK